jgi:hypothetical protein
MAKYIFYTDEGYTIAPNGKDIENLQVLGIEDGESKDEAYNNLFKNNKWIKENGFSAEMMRCYEIVSKH